MSPVHVLTDDDALGLGLSPVVTNGQIDNPLVEELINEGRLPQTDKMGRPIISFSQYLRLRKKVYVANYALWMERPGHRGVWTVQASKYLRFYRDGWEAVGAPEEHRHSLQELINLGFREDAAEAYIRQRQRGLKKTPVRPPEPIDKEDDEGIVLYRCADKYPECKRFFDNPKGLRLHWDKDHEGKFKRRAKAKGDEDAPG